VPRIVHIPDSDGRRRSYLLERCEPGISGELWSARLQKVSIRREPWRRVRLVAGFGWDCDCEDMRKGDARKRGLHCKHICAVAPLAAEEGIVSEAEGKPKPEKKAAQPDRSELLRRALRRPFDPAEVKWKPQAVSKHGNSAMAVAYIDARAVMDRLDEAVGVGNWRDEYTEASGGVVLCRLSLRVGGEWVSKEDVGSESEQPDPQDKRKAAYSDALKRAAVKWGIGRYLYHLPQQWVPYDKQKRCFTQKPQLPAWALPSYDADPPPPADPEPEPEPAPAQQPQQRPAQAPPPRPQQAQGGPQPQPVPHPPGVAFLAGVMEYEEQLAFQGLCKRGELTKYLQAAGREANQQNPSSPPFPDDLGKWNADQIALARHATEQFVKECRERKAAQKKQPAQVA
jgi:hypothetical protein